MKKLRNLATLLILATFMVAPAWAQQQEEAIEPRLETPAVESPADALPAQPLAVVTCLSFAPQCPAGSQSCAGVPLGGSCGANQICRGTCRRLGYGTVCKCRTVTATADSAVQLGEEEILAAISSSSCEDAAPDVSTD